MPLEHLTEQTLQDISEGKKADFIAENHLRTCSRCRDHLEVMRAVESSLKVAPPVNLPADFSLKVVAELERQMDARKVWREWLSYGLMGVVGILVSVYFTGSQMTFDIFVNLAADILKNGGFAANRDLRSLLGDGSWYVIYAAFLLVIFDQLDQRLIQHRRGHPTARF